MFLATVSQQAMIAAQLATGTPMAINGATTPTYSTQAHPSAIYVSSTDTTWVAWESWNGRERICQVRTYDHTADTWSDVADAAYLTLADDDHGVPVLCRDHQGYVHMFYGSHGTTGTVRNPSDTQRHAVTLSADDPSQWSEETGFGSDRTYPHPTLVGSALYVFTRFGNANIGDLQVNWTTSLSGGTATWSSQTVFDATNESFYPGICLVDGTDIIVSGTIRESDEDREGIYVIVYDTLTGGISNLQGTVAVTEPNLPINRAALDADFLLVDTSGDLTQVPAFCIDTGGNYHFAYPKGSSDPFSVEHAIWDGSTLTTSTVSGVSVEAGEQSGGSAISWIEELALVALPAGEVALYAATDAGSEYVRGGDMKRYVRSPGGTWGAPSTVLSADNLPITRPGAIVGASSDARLTFCETSVTPGGGTGSADDNAGRTNVYLYGDSGFIAPPEPVNSTPTFVGSAAANSDVTPIPSGAIAGDLVVCVGYGRRGTNAPNRTALADGWREAILIRRDTTDTFTNNFAFRAIYKIIDGSESSVTKFNAGSDFTEISLAFRGLGSATSFGAQGKIRGGGSSDMPLRTAEGSTATKAAVMIGIECVAQDDLYTTQYAPAADGSVVQSNTGLASGGPLNLRVLYNLYAEGAAADHTVDAPEGSSDGVQGHGIFFIEGDD